MKITTQMRAAAARFVAQDTGYRAHLAQEPVLGDPPDPYLFDEWLAWDRKGDTLGRMKSVEDFAAATGIKATTPFAARYYADAILAGEALLLPTEVTS